MSVASQQPELVHAMPAENGAQQVAGNPTTKKRKRRKRSKSGDGEAVAGAVEPEVVEPGLMRMQHDDDDMRRLEEARREHQEHERRKRQAERPATTASTPATKPFDRPGDAAAAGKPPEVPAAAAPDIAREDGSDASKKAGEATDGDKTAPVRSLQPRHFLQADGGQAAGAPKESRPLPDKHGTPVLPSNDAADKPVDSNTDTRGENELSQPQQPPQTDVQPEADMELTPAQPQPMKSQDELNHGDTIYIDNEGNLKIMDEEPAEGEKAGA